MDKFEWELLKADWSVRVLLWLALGGSVAIVVWVCYAVFRAFWG